MLYTVISEYKKLHCLKISKLELEFERSKLANMLQISNNPAGCGASAVAGRLRRR
jgi:hypothetical protein